MKEKVIVYLKKKMYDNSPICAIATGNVSAPVAIVRISGENILNLLIGNLQFKKKYQQIEPRKVYNAEFIDNSGRIIDDVIFIYFKSPHSYTGEDVIEIHVHGSQYIKQRVIKTLLEKGIRYAERGEFTLRAYLNKKIDLAQAEAINDLIISETEKAHNVIYHQYKGSVSTLIENLRKQIKDILVYLELELDFAEEDVEFASREKIIEILKSLRDYVDNLSLSYSYGNALKKGISVSILGIPNSGKSTLMNTLLKENRSIVTDIPGTTRDIIEDYFNYNGLTFRFADTAGLRKTTEIVEKEGIERAINKSKESLIILYLFDVTQSLEEQLNIFRDLQSNTSEQQMIIALINKIDKISEEKLEEIKCIIEKAYKFYSILQISAKYNINIDAILNKMNEIVEKLNVTGNEYIITNERHYNILLKSKEFIKGALNALEKNLPSDILVEELKLLNHSLSEITGEITSTEVLQEIFSRFCIGK